MPDQNFINDYDNTISIQNNSDILAFIVELQTHSYLNNRIALTSISKESLVSAFGRQTTTVNLSNRNYMWRIVFCDLVFWIFRSKRGTSIELVLPKNDLPYEDTRKFLTKNKDTVKDFIRDIDNRVNNV